MAVKDFKVEQGQKAIVVDGNGKAYKMDKLSKKVQNAMVIGTDIYKNDLGEDVLHIWID